MTRLRTVALISAVFVVVGPSVGAVVIWLERPPGSVGTVVLLSYAFGGIPALIAGIVYGGVSVRRRGAPSPWYVQALLGAGAGLLGCLAFFLFVSAYDLLTVSGWTPADLELRFLRRSVGAGIPAGIISALLVGSRGAGARTE